MAIQISVSEEIAAYIEDVFNYSMDSGNLAAWQSELIEAYTDDPPGVGNISTQVRKIAGIKVESQLECIEFAPPYRAAFQVIKGPVPFTVVQTYEETEIGTRFSIIVDGEVVGPLKVLGEGRVASQTEKELIANLAALKTIFEG